MQFVTWLLNHVAGWATIAGSVLKKENAPQSLPLEKYDKIDQTFKYFKYYKEHL